MQYTLRVYPWRNIVKSITPSALHIWIERKHLTVWHTYSSTPSTSGLVRWVKFLYRNPKGKIQM